MKKRELKPLVKWAGGKSQILGEISLRYPKGLGQTIKKYAEPFVGGGAVLFHILAHYELSQVYISDINAELINMYRKVKTDVDEVIGLLQKYQSDYIPLDSEARQKYYYASREQYNDLITSGASKDSLLAAALFIFLNRTCFNGLYRVNRKGLYNVPMGVYKNPLICDEDNLRAVSAALQNVEIVCGDYRKSRSFIDKDTFVYFDPPYRPLSKTSSFTAYTENVFDDTSQIELAEYAKELARLGAYVTVSNSDPKNTEPEDNFLDYLYGDLYVERISANRMINSNGEARGKISELLISSYAEKIDGLKEKEMRDFDDWMSRFRENISDYRLYVDFDKVYINVDKIKVELNILNSLIGSRNIKEEFIGILKRYPETLNVIPILLAKREKEIYCQDENGGVEYRFNVKKYPLNSPEIYEQYAYFMEKTGLFELLQDHLIGNLVDYVTGVETGLSSNGRKNRVGHLMENLIEGFICKAGFTRDVSYFKEMYIHQIEDKWGIDLSAISNQGKAEKRFDFVVKTQDMIYGIETNFYSGNGGSKLNETARSYKTLALESNSIDGFTFVWFTDGKGWKKARHNLEETFDVMENIYSIDDLENGIMNKIFK